MGDYCSPLHMSYEPILALVLYTDLYVISLKTFEIFFGWQNICFNKQE